MNASLSQLSKCPWEDGIKIILQRDDRLSLASYDIILSPQRKKCFVARVLPAQRRNIVRVKLEIALSRH